MTAGLVQIAIQIPPLRARGVSIRPTWAVRSEAFKKILLLMGPMVLGLTVTQINTLADDIIAKCLSGSAEKGEFFAWFGSQIRYPVWDGAVSKLYYSQRLYQFPLGVLGISLATAIFPVMSAQAAKKDFDALLKTISRGLRGAVFVAVPATAGLILIARPLASAVFERGKFTSNDTQLTAWTLSFYALGLCGYFLQQIATRAFYSMQDSKMPALTAAAAVVANIALNLTLIWFMGTAGLALSTAICSYLQVVILVFVLRSRFGPSLLDGLLITVVKTMIATAFMVLAAWLVLKVMKPLPISPRLDVLRLVAVVPSAAIVYAVAAKLLKVRMLSLITGTQQK
jgi:putative peptidoglycan lipid II flippase